MYLSVINRNISVISWNFISANARSLLWVTGAEFDIRKRPWIWDQNLKPETKFGLIKFCGRDF